MYWPVRHNRHTRNISTKDGTKDAPPPTVGLGQRAKSHDRWEFHSVSRGEPKWFSGLQSTRRFSPIGWVAMIRALQRCRKSYGSRTVCLTSLERGLIHQWDSPSEDRNSDQKHVSTGKVESAFSRKRAEIEFARGSWLHYPKDHSSNLPLTG